LIRPTVMKIAWGNHFSLLKFSCIRLSLNRNFEAYFLLNHWTCRNRVATFVHNFFFQPLLLLTNYNQTHCYEDSLRQSF
jgi:hypothetical protein